MGMAAPLRAGEWQVMVRDRSVAKLLAPVNLQLSVLVVVLTGLGIIGTALTRQTVDQLTTEISPAAVANAAVQRDMLVLQSGTQAWVQSGQPVVLRPYRIGAAELEANLERLAGYAVPGSELDGLLTVQAEAIAELTAADAAVGPVMDMADLANDPHVLARGSIAEVGHTPMQALIARLSATPGVLRHEGRPLDADGDAIRGTGWSRRGARERLHPLTLLVGPERAC